MQGDVKKPKECRYYQQDEGLTKVGWVSLFFKGYKNSVEDQ